MPDPIHPSDPEGSPEFSRSRYGTAEPGYDPGAGDAAPQRNWRDYLIVLRERFWIIIVVFLAVVLATVFYTLRKTSIYTATATVEILRSTPVVLPIADVVNSDVRTAEDLNTQVRVLESGAIIQRVASRLVGEEMRRFMAPYDKGQASDPITPIELLGRNRKVIPLRMSLVIAVSYSHPDAATAARVADLFVEEYIAHKSSMRVEESMKAVEDLNARANEQRRKVEDIQAQLQAYKESNNMVSLDERKDIVTDKLKQLNGLVTQAAARFSETEVAYNLVREFQAEKRPLTDLSFIGQQPLITSLQQQLAAQRISVAQLGERYRAKHPRMIEASRSLAETESSLAEAVRSAAAKVEADYLAAQRTLAEARSAFAAQETEALKLDRLSGDYENLSRELLVNEQLFQATLGRMRETTMSSTLDTQNARIMDRAARPIAPSSPNHKLNIAVGCVGGLGLGLALAFAVAFVDDRVKSSFDVEGVIGLPLLGIVPMLRKMDPSTRAQVVLNNDDRRAAEAFRSLHSSLKLDEISRRARVILVTSTIPGEGKSFVSTNLALTFAAHGERTLLIDADLRKPSLARLLNATAERGVVDLSTDPELPLEKLVQGGLRPDFDLLAAGGRSKNPTQLLSGRPFARVLKEAKATYDRIIIDTPPLAAVSDAINLLPFVDGCVFTLQFNRVRRRTAKLAAHRLLESSTPVFGAVLNALSLSMAGYYYAGYDDRSYKDYYLEAAAPEKSGKS